MVWWQADEHTVAARVLWAVVVMHAAYWTVVMHAAYWTVMMHAPQAAVAVECATQATVECAKIP